MVSDEEWIVISNKYQQDRSRWLRGELPDSEWPSIKNRYIQQEHAWKNQTPIQPTVTTSKNILKQPGQRMSGSMLMSPTVTKKSTNTIQVKKFQMSDMFNPIKQSKTPLGLFQIDQVKQSKTKSRPLRFW